MSDVVIRVKKLSKRYLIGRRERYNTLRDVLSDRIFSPLRRFSASIRGSTPSGKDELASSKEWIWSLKDVSFDIRRGEVVGIIGPNGAGKTTLLKILSRITRPTKGCAEVRGRVGSLLEVGTGFHSELTGRENIYLSGAILGMKKAEIVRKFDDIVDFAEVGKFIDTPVKRFSSGMYVRLAFAVASHLEPEILMVDEVLAVGDIDFQKKCIGSMQTVAKSGRTVIVVSHNAALVESLCGNAIWLSGGRLRTIGPAGKVVSEYLTASHSPEKENLLDHPGRTLHTYARFSSIQIKNATGDSCRDIPMGSGITLSMSIVADRPINQPWIGIQIRTSFDQLLFHIANREAGYKLPAIQGNCVVNCHIDRLILLPGRYILNLILADMSNTQYDHIPAAAYFDVRPFDVLHTGMPMEKDYGLVFFKTRWELEEQK